MAFEMSDKPQLIVVYNYLSSTCEFIGIGEAYIAPDTGLPSYCTNTPPPKAKKGYAIIFDEVSDKWRYLRDYRGQIVFHTDTRQSFLIEEPGPLPASTTLLVPGAFDIWNGEQWIKDEAAEKGHFIADAESQKQQFLNRAAAQINVLQDAVDLDMATTEEAAALLAWKKYRVALNRVDPTQAPDIEWPEVPA